MGNSATHSISDDNFRTLVVRYIIEGIIEILRIKEILYSRISITFHGNLWLMWRENRDVFCKEEL